MKLNSLTSQIRINFKRHRIMEAVTLSEARVYVGTYNKYNSGSLFGKWLDLSDYSDKDEFLEACADLHKDEQDPEYMFQDYENIPETLFSESSLSEKFFELRDATENMDETVQEAFFIWCEDANKDFNKEDADSLVSAFTNDYIGQYDSEEDYAEEYIREIQDLSDFVLQYFNYAQYATDLFYSGYWFKDGFVFYRS